MVKSFVMYYFGGKHINRALEAEDFIEDPPNQCQCVGSSSRGARWRWLEGSKVNQKLFRSIFVNFSSVPPPDVLDPPVMVWPTHTSPLAPQHNTTPSRHIAGLV